MTAKKGIGVLGVGRKPAACGNRRLYIPLTINDFSQIQQLGAIPVPGILTAKVACPNTNFTQCTIYTHALPAVLGSSCNTLPNLQL